MFFTRYNSESSRPLEIFTLECPDRVSRLDKLRTYLSSIFSHVDASNTTVSPSLNGEQTEQFILFLIQLTNFHPPGNVSNDGFSQLYESHKHVRDFVNEAFKNDSNDERIVRFKIAYADYLKLKVDDYSSDMRSFYKKKSVTDIHTKKQILNQQSELLSSIIQPIRSFCACNQSFLAHSPLLSRASVFFVDLLCKICNSDEVIAKVSQDKPDLIFESLKHFLALRMTKIFVDDEHCCFKGLFETFLQNTFLILNDLKLDSKTNPPCNRLEHLIPELFYDVLSNPDFNQVYDRYHIELFSDQQVQSLPS